MGAILVIAPCMALALWMFHLTVPKSVATFTAGDGAVMLAHDYRFDSDS